MTAALLVSALPLFAQAPRPYHLVLEASPGTVFPYLGRFGNVELHVYPGGIRAEALWLNAFSRNHAAAVTVANPLGRMYVDMNVADIAPTLAKLAGAAGAVERGAVATLGPSVNGTVGGMPATRHRLSYGTSFIDVWTTSAIPENAQLRVVADELLRGISPETLPVWQRVRGTPILIELNFRRFKKVKLLTIKKLTFDAEDEEDALTLGPLYVRAGVLERLWQ